MSATAATLLAANAKKALAQTLTNDELISFLFAGNAIFTLFNEETCTRYTYQFEEKAYTFVRNGRDVKGTCYWVKLLTGPHNTKDYTYLGSLKNKSIRTFALAANSRLGQADLPSVQAISWLLARIEGYEQGRRADVTSGPLKAWHAGRCGRCGRVLTTPQSLLAGYGPECLQYAAQGIERNLKVAVLS